MNQLLWRLSYLSSCLAKRLQAFWISGRPTNPSHFLASYRLHQARVGLPYEALVTFIICFFYWFFQLRLPNLHSRYKAENSTLIYLGRSIHWQKEEANRNLLSIHLKITLLLLLLTPFDFLLLCLLCLLCLCLLRHCSLCATCDYTWTYSKWWCDSSSHYSSIPSQGPIIVLYHLNLSLSFDQVRFPATYFIMFRYILGKVLILIVPC